MLQSVPVDQELYLRLLEYERESGRSVRASVQEALETFLKCAVPPRLEKIRSERPHRISAVTLSAEKKMRIKYQIETEAAG